MFYGCTRMATVSVKVLRMTLILLQGNVPIGDVDIPRVIVSDLPRCHCKPDTESPCGPDSDCINRCMFYECHPAVCPAAKLCLNQRFQRRQYAAVKPFRTERRGWGLLASADIAKVPITYSSRYHILYLAKLLML